MSKRGVTIPLFLNYLRSHPPVWGSIDFRESINKPISGTYYRLVENGRYDVFGITYYIDYAEQRVNYSIYQYYADETSIINELTSNSQVLALTIARLDLTSARNILSKDPSVDEFIQHRWKIVTHLRPSIYTLLAQYVYYLINDYIKDRNTAPHVTTRRSFGFTELQYMRPIQQERQRLEDKLTNIL